MTLNSHVNDTNEDVSTTIKKDENRTTSIEEKKEPLLEPFSEASSESKKTKSPLKCSCCSKKIKYPSDLKRHEVRCSTLKTILAPLKRKSKLKCPKCDKSYKYPSDLKRHKVLCSTAQTSRALSVVKPLLKCPKCESSFKYPSDLKRHVKKHKNERRFEIWISN